MGELHATDASLRFFGQPESVPTDQTVLYSGFVVERVGDGAGTTTFYDWLELVRRAYECATGRGADDVAALARWFGGNVRRAHETAAELGLPYLSLGSALGATDPVLALSVVERTREIGLLRAAVFNRRSVRRMIRLESVLIALFGAVLGLGLGMGWGISAQRLLASTGLDVLSIPWPTIAFVFGGAGVVGLIAALLPALRASRMKVLRAIATE